VDIRKKFVIAAVSALAVGGAITGSVVASAAPAAPAPSANAPAAPGVPAAPATATEAGEVSGAPETDNIHHQATGDEGNHADEPAAQPGK
jgi:hypothetical protein